MKKFKLIKEYPDSPELGIVVTFADDKSRFVYRDEWEGSKKIDYFVTPDECEKFPEFWEQIIEYVKCIRSENNEYILNKIYKLEDFRVRTEDNYLGKQPLPSNLKNHYGIADFAPSTEEEYNAQPKEELCVPIGTKFKVVGSDSIIYTISDITDDNTVKITLKNDLTVTKMILSIRTINKNFANGYWRIYNNPLFITEDNVDIFEGDMHWFITGDFGYCGQRASSIDAGRNYGHTFSTKEKAEKYIYLNTPIYTRQDLLNFVASPVGYGSEYITALDNFLSTCQNTEKNQSLSRLSNG